MSSPARLTCAVALLACGSAAASAALRDGEPRARVFVDAATPLFGSHNAGALHPGGRTQACVAVANTGSGHGRAVLYAPSVAGPLARHLRVVVTRGRGGDRGCEQFTPDGRAYGLDAAGVLFRGRLSEFPSSVSDAVIDPVESPPGAAHTYRFSLTLDDDDAAEGLATRWDWRLAAESVGAHAAASSREGCGRVRLAGAARGRSSRTLVRTVRVRGRVRSVLVVRVLGAAGAERLVLTTGLRVRRKTLVIPRWARVSYRVNGMPSVGAGRRPFRVRVAAGAIHAGANRIAVRVRPRRGRAQTTTFSLRAMSTTVEGRRVCVLGA